MDQYSSLITALKFICLDAGKKIMEVYNDPENFGIEFKDDNSPLTRADKLANEVIIEGLKALPHQYPIISEEGKDIPYDQRKGWPIFWLVDPLDGTKEFIKRNGQFTVNIALIDNHIPVIGFIYAPVSDELFYGIKGIGSFKICEDGECKISSSTRKQNLVSVGSSSHANEEEAEHLAKFPIVETIKWGSSLKFCKVAEGTADVYLRTGPTMEWDTAAGQCILENAGAKMTKLDGSPFLYNKQSLLNEGFVCLAQ